jgi:hypothetical protein
LFDKKGKDNEKQKLWKIRFIFFVVTVVLILIFAVFAKAQNDKTSEPKIAASGGTFTLGNHY